MEVITTYERPLYKINWEQSDFADEWLSDLSCALILVFEWLLIKSKSGYYNPKLTS